MPNILEDLYKKKQEKLPEYILKLLRTKRINQNAKVSQKVQYNWGLLPKNEDANEFALEYTPIMPLHRIFKEIQAEKKH